MAKNVLIVDNDRSFSTILSEGLNSHPAFSAAVVRTCKSAMTIVAEKPVDLVIIDLGVSDMPIPDLITGIREARAEMPIMVTPALGHDVPDALMKQNLQGVLPKPFFVGDLPKLVGDALGLNLESEVPELVVIEQKSALQSRRERRQAERERLAREKAEAAAKAGRPPEPEPEIVESPAEEAPRQTYNDAPLPALESWKLKRLRKDHDKIVDQLNDLNEEVHADVIVLTAGSELMAMAGSMSQERAQEFAHLVARAAEASALTAEFLGERDGRFEQALHEGDEYKLYSYSLGEGVVLALALSTDVPLGTLRLQTRRTGKRLSEEYVE